jgi:hypothetical protein
MGFPILSLHGCSYLAILQTLSFGTFMEASLHRHGVGLNFQPPAPFPSLEVEG